MKLKKSIYLHNIINLNEIQIVQNTLVLFVLFFFFSSK